MQKFVEVFSDELSGLLQEQKISSEIEFLYETGLIPNAPYRMAPTELKRTSNAAAGTVRRGFYSP